MGGKLIGGALILAADFGYMYFMVRPMPTEESILPALLGIAIALFTMNWMGSRS